MITAVHPLDAAIIVAYLATMAGVGVYFSRRQTTLDDYFLRAGRWRGCRSACR